MAVFLSSALCAQDLTGSWYGILEIPGKSLRVNFHIKLASGVFSSTMDSPDQGVHGIPTEKTTISEGKLTIEAPKMGLSYRATFDKVSNQLIGTFTQGPGELPLNLTRTQVAGEEKPKAKRPQDPTSFPYLQQEVSFGNKTAGNEISGTLTMPRDGKAKKIVVMVSGSGPQDRNEEVAQFNHRPFLVWSDYLTRNGIAVLRYDERGVGKSTGTFNGATTADFADDAKAAIDYIQSRADLKSMKIGVIGHSEGGMIAPMLASTSAAVKFIVLLAAPGVPISELLVQQNKDQMILAGVPDSTVARNSALNQQLYASANSLRGLNQAQFAPKLDSVLTKVFTTASNGTLSASEISRAVNSATSQVATPWFRYFIAFQPSAYLTKVKCPVLAINGTKDMQVSSGPNLRGISEGLSKAGNKNFTILPIKDLNHLLQLSRTGSGAEYAELEETVNPQALEAVATWIIKI